MAKRYENPLTLTPRDVVEIELKSPELTVWFFDCRQIVDDIILSEKDSSFNNKGYTEIRFRSNVNESILAGDGPRFFFMGVNDNGSEIILELRKLWGNKKNGQFVGWGYYKTLEECQGNKNLSYDPIGYAEFNKKTRADLRAEIELQDKIKNAGFDAN